jgi:anti-sigma B factor antagonist
VAQDRGKFGDVITGEIALDRSDNGLAVLTINGEHDLSTAPDLRKRLDELVGDRKPIVVDLSPASFVDSSILGVLIDGRRRTADAGIGFAVCHADGSDAVGRVLEITGLREEMPVHGTRAAAEAAATTGSS